MSLRENNLRSQRHLEVDFASGKANTEVTVNDDIIHFNLKYENNGRNPPEKLTPLMGQNKGGIQVDSTKKSTYSGLTPLMPNPLNQSTGCFLMGRGGGGGPTLRGGSLENAEIPQKCDQKQRKRTQRSPKSPKNKKIGHKNVRNRSKNFQKTPKKNKKIDEMFEKLKSNRKVMKDKIISDLRKLEDHKIEENKKLDVRKLKIELEVKDNNSNEKQDVRKLEIDGKLKLELDKEDVRKLEVNNENVRKTELEVRKLEKKKEHLTIKKDRKKFKQKIEKKNKSIGLLKFWPSLLSNNELEKSTFNSNSTSGTQSENVEPLNDGQDDRRKP